MPFAQMTAGQIVGYIIDLLLTLLAEVGCLLLFTPLARFVEKILGFLTGPMQKPIDKFRDKLETPTGPLAPFGGLLGIAYLVCATVFCCVASHAMLSRGTTYTEFFTDLLFNTAFGAFASLFQDNFSGNFTPVAFVSIGVSAFIAGFFASSLKNAKWYVKLPGHVISLVASAILARLLTAPFQAVADWGAGSIVSLYHWQAAGFFPVLWKILLLILLCYIALLLILMTLHEYLVLAACVLPAFAVSIPVILIMVNITHPSVQAFWNNWADAILVAICVLAAELIQPYLEEVYAFVRKQIPRRKKHAK